MIYYVVTRADGWIVQVGSKSEASFPHLTARPGETIRKVPFEVKDEEYFWKDGLQPLPPRPNQWAAFDTASETWIEAVDLTSAKAFARQDIEHAVANARRHFATDLPFQDEAYKLKQEEAVAYIALDPEPADLADFPNLQNEVGSTAPTAYQLAQIWLNKRDAWPAALNLTEGIRTTHNNAVAAAQSVAAIDALVAAAKAALTTMMEQS